jgi:hypothetical protein
MPMADRLHWHQDYPLPLQPSPRPVGHSRNGSRSNNGTNISGNSTSSTLHTLLLSGAGVMPFAQPLKASTSSPSKHPRLLSMPSPKPQPHFAHGLTDPNTSQHCGRTWTTTSCYGFQASSTLSPNPVMEASLPSFRAFTTRHIAPWNPSHKSLAPSVLFNRFLFTHNSRELPAHLPPQMSNLPSGN